MPLAQVLSEPVGDLHRLGPPNILGYETEIEGPLHEEVKQKVNLLELDTVALFAV